MNVGLNAISALSVCLLSMDRGTSELYTLSLHDALPISGVEVLTLPRFPSMTDGVKPRRLLAACDSSGSLITSIARARLGVRKSTRLNSSHPSLSYAVFCWKKNRPKVIYHT